MQSVCAKVRSSPAAITASRVPSSSHQGRSTSGTVATYCARARRRRRHRPDPAPVVQDRVGGRAVRPAGVAADARADAPRVDHVAGAWATNLALRVSFLAPGMPGTASGSYARAGETASGGVKTGAAFHRAHFGSGWRRGSRAASFPGAPGAWRRATACREASRSADARSAGRAPMPPVPPRRRERDRRCLPARPGTEIPPPSCPRPPRARERAAPARGRRCAGS